MKDSFIRGATLAIIGAIIFASIFIRMDDVEGATRTLEGAGYSQIELTGYKWFACSENDFYSTGFTAVGPTGKSVEGAVCSGMFIKNSTIRFD